MKRKGPSTVHRLRESSAQPPACPPPACPPRARRPAAGPHGDLLRPSPAACASSLPVSRCSTSSRARNATPHAREPAQRRPPTWLRCARWRCAEGNRKQTRKDKGWPQSASLKEAPATRPPPQRVPTSEFRNTAFSFLFMNVHHRGPHNPPIAQIKVKRDNAESHTVLNTMDTVRAASAQCPVPHT